MKNAGKTGSEWLTYGLTPAETRYRPLTQITTTNVSRLGLAWSYDLGSGAAGLRELAIPQGPFRAVDPIQ